MRPASTRKLDPSHPHYNPDPHAHPGLHIIALIEAVKGVLAVLAASGLASSARHRCSTGCTS